MPLAVMPSVERSIPNAQPHVILSVERSLPSSEAKGIPYPPADKVI